MTDTLIFTDLDGTLLDHETYDYAAALPVLARLEQAGVPVILTTSKTRAELASLQAGLGNHHPAIAENGAVIGEDVAGPGYGAIRDLIAKVQPPLTGFGDMTADQVAEITGLCPTDAALAKQREATEPFLWHGDEAGLAELRTRLADHGLTLTQGGRFHHIVPGRDKAGAMKQLAAATPDKRLIALGDGPNDSAMLLAADVGVVMPNAHGVSPGLAEYVRIGRLREAPMPGPAGWATAVQELVFANKSVP